MIYSKLCFSIACIDFNLTYNQLVDPQGRHTIIFIFIISLLPSIIRISLRAAYSSFERTLVVLQFQFQYLALFKSKKMAYKGQKVQKVMVQPINLIFRYLQNRSRIQVWVYEQINLRIEGHIIGFDEYMNLVLEDAEEVHLKKQTRKPLGRIMLKGDNITLIQSVQQQS
ncbi:small nuclear ribonucleoprotein E-like [Anneissia japonica]|uniref:small nuclear ribonucleoprotein E-like n=1 Tax=Anneissia japonica TaxID=1529436 RepID=UPI001425A178|nr:small nuclear ribonucleoprotein E-like [Anneissia japonica]